MSAICKMYGICFWYTLVWEILKLPLLAKNIWGKWSALTFTYSYHILIYYIVFWTMEDDNGFRSISKACDDIFDVSGKKYFHSSPRNSYAISIFLLSRMYISSAYSYLCEGDIGANVDIATNNISLWYICFVINLICSSMDCGGVITCIFVVAKRQNRLNTE